MFSKIKKVFIITVVFGLIWQFSFSGIERAMAADKTADEQNVIASKSINTGENSNSDSAATAATDAQDNQTEPIEPIEPAVEPSLPEIKDAPKESVSQAQKPSTVSASSQPTAAKPKIQPSAVAGEVVINEIMWMGSEANSADEWLELRNMTSGAIDLSGWVITGAAYSGGDLTIPTGKSIPALGYFLVANYNQTSSDSVLNISPDWQIASINLPNSAIQFVLKDNLDTPIDTADDGVGAPVAGDNSSGSGWHRKWSMERNSVPGDGTVADNWHTAVVSQNFKDYATERGTPKAVNAEIAPMPTINSIDAKYPYYAKDNSAVIPVEIFGDKFIPSDLKPAAAAILEAELIGSNYDLTNVTFKNPQRIKVDIPAGVAEGQYDLKVTNPDDQSGILNNAFIVDLTPPQSQATSPKITNKSSFYIYFTSSDSLSGVDTVNLWFRKDGGPRQLGKLNITSPYLFNVTLGQGVYDFYTIATDKAGNSEEVYTGSDATTKVDWTSPTSPQNLQAITGEGFVYLSWTANPDAVYYEIWRIASPAELIGKTADSFFKDTNVIGGKYYIYQIVAIDKAGNRSAIAEISASPPLIIITGGGGVRIFQPEIASAVVEQEPVKEKEKVAPTKEPQEPGEVQGKETEEEVPVNWPLIIGIALAGLVVLFWIYYWYVSWKESKENKAAKTSKTIRSKRSKARGRK